MQTSRLYITFDHIFQTRLINRNFAEKQTVNFILVDIDTRDIDTHFCKTSPGYQSDISRTYNCDNHKFITMFILYPLPAATRRKFPYG